MDFALLYNWDRPNRNRLTAFTHELHTCSAYLAHTSKYFTHSIYSEREIQSQANFDSKCTEYFFTKYIFAMVRCIISAVDEAKI